MYRETGGTRPRDADLEAQDRVDVIIDIDRDWTTYYQLSVDHRGWTADRFWNNASWNPQWFVARERSGGTWRIEAAIALDELAPKPPAPNDAWVIGLQRLAPATLFAAWSQPASPEVRSEGFGYLMFSPPDVR
jgi:hypothetical protein